MRVVLGSRVKKIKDLKVNEDLELILYYKCLYPTRIIYEISLVEIRTLFCLSKPIEALPTQGMRGLN